MIIKCFKCGGEMKKLGYGKYPYDCINKDKHPNAMIYKDCVNGCSIGWATDINDCENKFSTQKTK